MEGGTTTKDDEVAAAKPHGARRAVRARLALTAGRARRARAIAQERWIARLPLHGLLRVEALRWRVRRGRPVATAPVADTPALFGLLGEAAPDALAAADVEEKVAAASKKL